ncbi:MAG: c(7)-type cytochrome triheme domain-containing protein, partial [Candidatus Binatia bacterium]
MWKNLSMSRFRNGVAFLILLSVSSLAACLPETRPQVFSVFNEVPRPGEEAAPPPEAPRPSIEKLRDWEEVLKALPKDVVGGADWVKAIKQGVIAPRVHLDPTAPPEPPFSLATLVGAIPSNGKAPFELDIELIPTNNPFFKVVFPHSSHTLWLNCSSCHPSIVAQRGAGMAKIFAGEYCGKCHGKVSFAPATGCPRCHVNLPAPGGEKQGRGFGVKGEIVFPRKPQGASIPPATFPHWFHRIRFRCTACHPAIFAMQRGANPITMDAMKNGKFCATCHNGKIAWEIGFATCTRCHVTRQVRHVGPSKDTLTEHPPAEAGGLVLWTESPDTGQRPV